VVVAAYGYYYRASDNNYKEELQWWIDKLEEKCDHCSGRSVLQDIKFKILKDLSD